jgi:hypothetical protein
MVLAQLMKGDNYEWQEEVVFLLAMPFSTKNLLELSSVSLALG